MLPRMYVVYASKLGPVFLLGFALVLVVHFLPHSRHATPPRPIATRVDYQEDLPDVPVEVVQSEPERPDEDKVPEPPKPQQLGFRDMLDIVNDRETSTKKFWDFSRSAATEEAINNRNVSLPWVLRGYRNPCWLEYLPVEQTYAHTYYLRHDCMEQSSVLKSLTWAHETNRERRRENKLYRLRCFPYFFLLGVAKSGTTDLYYSISRYLKNVISGARKEPHFWNRRRLGVSVAGSCYNPQGPNAQLSDYLDLYDEAAEKIRLRADPKRLSSHPLVTGDFTPATLFSSPRWWRYPGNEGRDEPRYTTPHILHSLAPESRFIVILRDPVDRAYSQMRFRNLPADGRVAAAFHSLVISTLGRLQECNNLRGCVYNRTDPEAKHAAQNEVIIPGLYAIFIDDWLKVFPRENFLFLCFEEYVKDRVTAIDRVSTFLEIDPLTPADRYHVEHKNISNYGYEGEAMWDKTRDILRQFYRPWNHKLAQILGSKAYTWGY